MPDLATLLDPGLVRSAIDLSLDSAMLPDATVQSPIYGGAAVAEVLRRIPGAADLDDEASVQRLTTAVNLLTAAYLVPAVPVILRQQTAAGDSYQRQELPADLAGLLRARADAEIGEILAPGTDGMEFPPFFGVARGRRGQ